MEQGIVESRKDLKRNKIISTVRYNEMISRHEVKKRTGYSMTTVLNTINDLIEKRLLVEEDCDSVRVGRRPTWLHICPDGQYFIGVEFNADSLNCVVVDFAFQVIFSVNDRLYSTDTPESILEKIEAAIRRALDFVGEDKSKVLGIGLGLPGYVNKEKGLGVEYAYINGWRNIPIQRMIEEKFGYKVIIENNINTMTIAYRWMEYGERADDFVLLSMKYGLRMGMIIGNKLYSGNNGTAGEIGHVRLVNGYRYCSCGKKGCLDTEASFKAIKTKIIERMECGYFADIKEMVQGDMDRFSMSMFVESALQENPDSVDLMKETAVYLGESLAMALAAINPKQVIIASKSGMGGEVFSNMVYGVIQDSVPSALIENFSVKCIKAQDNIGAVGAAMMIMENEYQVAQEEV